jgi:SAM-dependent methyltransferase
VPIPLTPGEQDAYASGRATPAHLDFLGAMSFRTIAAASRLGIFAALADGPADAAQVAQRAQTDPHGTELLLSSLVAFGHLSAAGAPPAYALTEVARRHLLPGPASYALVVEFWMDNLQHLWANLEETVRTGRPRGDFYAWLEKDPAQRARFHAMLARLAGALAPELRALLDPAPGVSILDVGAGHGSYAAALLEALPTAAATLLDLPGALEQAGNTLTERGVAGRARCQPWDAATAPEIEGGPYDVALVFSLLHGFTPAQNAAILRRVHDALAPGGRIAVVEQILGAEGATPSGEAFLRLFSLNLFHGQGGQVWGQEAIMGWLAAAGFGEITAYPLVAAPTDQVIIARRR